MKFAGRVSFRSSISPRSGPPGEAEVLSLNPHRATLILKATGWNRLEPGSLNLEVAASVVDDLLLIRPALVEKAANIRYPAPHESIPISKRAYYYYRGLANAGGKSQDVLVRRALMNALPRRVELFAPISLKEHFGLAAGAEITVDLQE